MEHQLPNADDVNYWKTGKSSPVAWIDKCIALIEEVDGRILQQFQGRQGDRAAILIEFSIGEERYRIAWPVLPTKYGEDAAAMRQAATFLYHSVKQKCMDAKVLGVKTAFCESLLLPDGRRVVQLTGPEIGNHFPDMMGGRPALPPADETK